MGSGGSISIDAVDSVISPDARRAALASAGSPSDAVIWEDVEARTSESAELSFSFAAFMVLATLIAAIGILTRSQILIIGAMVVGPEFGPLAALCVALVQRRAAMAARSAAALAAGFPLGIAVAFALVLILRAAGPAPDALTTQGEAATSFISHPDVYSVLVALLAGVAGMLSLSTAKSGALLGVLISVTTIPAAANVGAAAAYADWQQARGALAQLGINVTCIVIAGTMILAAQRLGFRRRLRRAGGNTDTGLFPDLPACWPPALAAAPGRVTRLPVRQALIDGRRRHAVVVALSSRAGPCTDHPERTVAPAPRLMAACGAKHAPVAYPPVRPRRPRDAQLRVSLIRHARPSVSLGSGSSAHLHCAALTA